MLDTGDGLIQQGYSLFWFSLVPSSVLLHLDQAISMGGSPQFMMSVGLTRILRGQIFMILLVGVMILMNTISQEPR